MDIQSYLTQVADLVENGPPWTEGGSKKYVSKFDGSFIVPEGMENGIEFLADLEITDGLTHGVGFSPLHNKWFGWSHRACRGFTIGSKCEKGDCHYIPANIEDTLADMVSFWDDDTRKETTAKVISPGLAEISWSYSDDIPNELLRSGISSVTQSFDPVNFGRGEWVAETMEDAKQMAIDFSEGVS